MQERPDHRTRRPRVPPLDVVVDLARVWPAPEVDQGAPDWVRDHGLGLEPVGGVLTEMVATRDGRWLARVSFPVQVDGSVLHLDQLVPAEAVREADWTAPALGGPVPPRPPGSTSRRR